MQYCPTLEKAVKGAKALLLVTAWPEFQRVPGLLARMRNPPVVIDGRRLLAPASVAGYEGIGLSNCA
jgi:UDPglucose 6-dehydrogenase/GDP-mannose 6-dehydrogenase